MSTRDHADCAAGSVTALFLALALALVLVLWLPPVPASGDETDSSTVSRHRVYGRLLNPREHPDDDRRAVKPPTWDTFQNRSQFTCLRGFHVQDDLIQGYQEELDRFTRVHRLGTVIWPSYPILFAKNLGELAAEIKRRDLYLFDVWGYVPGSGPGGYWQQFQVPAEALAQLESTLGDRWLGTDIGEQDGRYIGGYASQMTPASAERLQQYLNFQRHFERMGDDLGHKHATLVSLNFGHYLLKEGTYTLIGAETAQALPNNQVYYTFIRGAGKQYGVPWFGNASVFNRWGFKSYDSSGRSDGYEHGPTKGTSLSLLRRLIYSHLLYNCVAVGFENGWFEGDQLSPIGRVQQSAQQWTQDHGQPGVMHTPVALLLDFYCGWSFPRHLYTEHVYRVWGNLPFEAGDYLTDGVLDMLYPGYQNSSYYHDESGFIAATPYGDLADCLLSDAPDWLLARYPVVVVAGALGGGQEIRDRLQAYVEQGGHLLITSGNLARLPGGLAGFEATTVSAVRQVGRGKITVLPTDWGVDVKLPAQAAMRSEVDQPLPKPYTLNSELRGALDAAFREQQLFDVGNPQLSFITCRKGPGEYTLGVANTVWTEQPLRITSRCGTIASIQELPLVAAERTAAGYLPEGVSSDALGENTDTTIAGGDVRLFTLRVAESGVEEIPHVAPPARPHGRCLPLRSVVSIQEAILARPTFFQHFDGVAVDWRYLHERERTALEREGAWIRRQQLRVFVDVSPGLNLYPSLRLLDNLPADYAASIAAITDVLDKMPILGARDLILSLHRDPENNFSQEQTRASFEETLRALARQAAQRQVTLQLRLGPGKPPWSLEDAEQLLGRVGATNLRLAVNTAWAERAVESPTTERILRDRVGLWLVAGPQIDASGQLYGVHAPLYPDTSAASLQRLMAKANHASLLLDAVYSNQDAEYRDAMILAELPTTR